MSTRRFRPYPTYKGSGVEWLAEIPAHWKVSRVSEVTTVLNGYPFDSEYFVRGEGTPLVRIRDLNAVDTEVNYIGPIVESAWIQSGDVIIGMDGDFNAARWRGQRALLNQRMCCLRPRGATDSGFIAYLLPLALQVINDLTYSTTVKHLSSVDVRKICVGAPPEPEQRAIAAFLDRETARIDALVARKGRLIELLREQRTALITRAATKGLDPTVPMKNSGVEWLGEIPAHWRSIGRSSRPDSDRVTPRAANALSTGKTARFRGLVSLTSGRFGTGRSSTCTRRRRRSAGRHVHRPKDPGRAGQDLVRGELSAEPGAGVPEVEGGRNGTGRRLLRQEWPGTVKLSPDSAREYIRTRFRGLTREG